MSPVNFFLYREDGKITLTGAMTEAMAQAQVQSGDFLGFGVVNPSTQYLASGVVTDMPTRLTEYHQFNYTSKQWEDPRTPATEWPLVRDKRDTLLSDTDWVITKAMEMGTPVPAAWRTYRQALRDITLQPDPFAVVWPVMPA